MVSTVKVDIVTPEKLVFSDDVRMVIARATDGDIGILPGHAPLIAGLKTNVVRIIYPDNNAKEKQIPVHGGFIEVQPNKITILASIAEKPENVDVDRALAAKERAEKRLLEAKDDSHIDVARAEAALSRAMTRLKAVEFNKHI